MERVKQLTVRYNSRFVGTMALYREQVGAFEYSSEWLADGFSLSPFSLPVEKRVYIPKIDPFEGLFGVFDDSLPDGWGRLLVDRFLTENKVNPMTVNSMDRLAIIGDSGMGAITYEPAHSYDITVDSIDLDKHAVECGKILRNEYSDNLDELFKLGGSSGGARPKILTTINGEEWIIKFPSSSDPKDIGEQEYRYSMCAKACGIEMEETRLFNSKICSGYFGTKRFDRVIGADETLKKVHMISVSGLLETSHRIPNLDYNILMKLTLKLTDDFSETEKLFRLMCFNVFAHNRDDHSKNFSFIYNEFESRWVLSPAYDLTFSSSLNGEHATTINGNGKNPGLSDIMAVADNIGISKRKARQIVDEVASAVKEANIISM
ncbi:MAG: type II toxin-antitoxin system HipA family toxin [Clostridiales bacterium]|nr:type II toxin-antitoxin system HipA family toxin [Clostridiales bacterium]